MRPPVRLLSVEDSAADYLLTLHLLKQEGLVAEAQRIDRMGDLDAALQHGPWDVIVSDYSVPGMPFRETLNRIQAYDPKLPVILFSGSVGEEEAVALLKLGVQDFILKDRPGRLVAAIQQAVLGAHTRKASIEGLQALAASEARFQATFEQAAIGIAQVALDGRFLRVNQRLCDILGYSQEELLCLRTQDLCSPQWAASTRAKIGLLLEGEKSTYLEEKPNIRKNGTEVWISLSVSLVRNPQGDPDYLVCIVEDIQRRRDAETALHDSETLLRAVMDSMGPGLVVLDEEGRILDVNRAWVDFGQANGADEALASGIGVNYFETLRNAHSETEAKTCLEGFQALLKGDLPRFEIEYPCPAPDQERWFHLAATALTGSRRGLVIIHTDITDRRRADAELRISEARFAAVFRASPIPIVLVRVEDTVIIEANGAFLTLAGFELNQVLGRTTIELGLWDQPEQRQVAMDRLASTGRIRNFELTFRRASGEVGQALLSAEIIQLGGQPILVDLIRDVTEIKAAREKEHQLEQELNHLQRLESVGRLAGGVSHDMNNVLAAILAMTNILQADPSLDERQVHKLDVIAQAAIRGRDLVKGLTDFSRKDVQDAVPIDLNVLVEQEADLLKHTTFKKIEIKVELQRPLPEIMGEASALSNVLMNLCVNACDAMPKGGSLKFQTRQRGEELVELAVTDTGAGMPSEIAEKAMEPFFTTKPAGKGTGLGLSIVYGTVKAHGGTVDIRSVPGEGTCITLSFPILAKRETPQIAQTPTLGERSQASRVLIVDDDELIRASAVDLLEMIGHQVQVASSGLEALRRLEAGMLVDLVILDLNMPGMNGIETLVRLRMLRPELPVLISSGHCDAETSCRIKAIPAVKLLNKPYSLHELAHAIQGVLGLAPGTALPGSMPPIARA